MHENKWDPWKLLGLPFKFFLLSSLRVTTAIKRGVYIFPVVDGRLNLVHVVTTDQTIVSDIQQNVLHLDTVSMMG